MKFLLLLVLLTIFSTASGCDEPGGSLGAMIANINPDACDMLSMFCLTPLNEISQLDGIPGPAKAGLTVSDVCVCSCPQVCDTMDCSTEDDCFQMEQGDGMCTCVCAEDSDNFGSDGSGSGSGSGSGDWDCSCYTEGLDDDVMQCLGLATISGDCAYASDDEEEMGECLEDWCFDEYMALVSCQLEDENCDLYQECPDCAGDMKAAYDCYLENRTSTTSICAGNDDETEVDGDGNTALDVCAMGECTDLVDVAEACQETFDCESEEEDESDDSEDGGVLCDGQDENDYCDCDYDCGENPSFCQCADALAPGCCSPVDEGTCEAMADSETLVIDVRPDSMREDVGYYECSTQIVYSQMTPQEFNDQVKTLVDNDMNHPIVIYCASAASAETVKATCLEEGFTNVYTGGAYSDLQTAGCECPADSCVEPVEGAESVPCATTVTTALASGMITCNTDLSTLNAVTGANAPVGTFTYLVCPCTCPPPPCVDQMACGLGVYQGVLGQGGNCNTRIDEEEAVTNVIGALPAPTYLSQFCCASCADADPMCSTFGTGCTDAAMVDKAAGAVCTGGTCTTDLCCDPPAVYVNKLTVAYDGLTDCAGSLSALEQGVADSLSNVEKEDVTGACVSRLRRGLTTTNVNFDIRSSTEDVAVEVHNAIEAPTFEQTVTSTTQAQSGLENVSVTESTNNGIELEQGGTTVTYTWVQGSWTTCTATCGSDLTQSRTVTCQSSAGDTVSDDLCTGETPAASQSCNLSECVNTPDVDCEAVWEECNTSCKEVYSISTQASGNGTACEAANGSERDCECSGNTEDGGTFSDAPKLMLHMCILLLVFLGY